MSAGRSITGGERTTPLPAVTYSEPAPKPKGLDWSKHRAPDTATDELAAVRDAATRDKADRARTELEDALRATDARPTPPVANVPTPPARAFSTEVTAVAYTLADTAGSTDMVVAACRAAVIAAADALRGAHAALAPPPRPAVAKPKATRATTKRTGTTQERRTRRPAVDIDVPGAQAEYAAGASLVNIAADHGYNICTLRRTLQRNGTPMRDDRATRSGGRNRLEDNTPQLVGEVTRLYVDEQQSQATIAARLGIGQQTVRRIMRDHGVVAREGQSGGGDTLQAYRDRLEAAGVTSQQVRVWAAGEGFVVSARGVIRGDVIDAYQAAHP